MQDTELYTKLLGLNSPWFVEKVELNLKQARVDIFAAHATEAEFKCPDCGRKCPLHDHSDERRWRHLDTMQFQTVLHARPPRVRCEEHGVKQVRLPWAEANSRFTAFFERLAIDVLLGMPIERARALLRISWDEAWGIKRRAVDRGLSRKEDAVLQNVGVDEKAFSKGHQYVTVVYNLDQGSVEYVADDRTKESLDEYLTLLSEKQKAGIKAIAMDMWEPYKLSVVGHLPNAESKIVYDRFHVMQHVSKAVDIVRRQENKQLMAQGDNTLKGAKYSVLKRQENLSETDQQRLWAILARSLRTSRAWAIQESIREFWNSRTAEDALALWKRIFFRATHSRLQPMRKAAHTLNRHMPNILTYFKHRITNACGEAINATIQAVKRAAKGFRNQDNFKIAIYFHCGNLDLYPETHGIPG